MALLRVFHLVDPGTPGGGPCTLRLAADVIAHMPDLAHDVFVLGTREDVALARSCGLDPVDACCPPRMAALAGRRSIVRMLDQHMQQTGMCDVLHGWSPRAAAFASVVLPQRPRIASLHVGPVPGKSMRAMRQVLSRSSTLMLAGSDAVAQAFDAQVMPHQHIQVLPGAADAAVAQQASRASLRRRWAVDDSCFVVGALCEPASDLDARRVMRAIVSVRMAGRAVRMVMPDNVTRRSDAVRWAKRLGAEDSIIFDPLAAQPWRIGRGLDAACVLSATASSPVQPLNAIMLQWMFACKVPVIADDRPGLSHFVTDGETGFLVPPDDISASCDRLARLYDDRTLGHTLADEADRRRVDIASHAAQLQACYEQHAAAAGN